MFVMTFLEGVAPANVVDDIEIDYFHILKIPVWDFDSFFVFELV